MKWIRRGAFLTACAGIGAGVSLVVVGGSMRRRSGAVVRRDETGPEAFEREILPRLRIVG